MFWSWFNWIFQLFGGPKAPTPDFITKVQAQTVKTCSYLPQATSVASVVAALTGQVGIVATVVAVATTICKAATLAKGTATAYGNTVVGKPVVVIDGKEIVIEGEWVNK